MRWVYVAVIAFIIGGIVLLRWPGQADGTPDGMTLATVGAVIDKTQKKLQIDDGKPLTVVDAAVPFLDTLKTGDQIFYNKEDQKKPDATNPKPEEQKKPGAATNNDEKKPETVITEIKLRQYNLGYEGAAGALLIAFAVIFAVILIVTDKHPWAFALGLDLRLSNSQTQVYLWFLVFATVYLADLGLRFGFTGFLGGIGAPARLLALSGISALTFGIARTSTTIKNNANVTANAAAAANPPPGGVVHKPTKTPPSTDRSRWQIFLDLFTNDHNEVDLGDFQMIVLTGLAVLLYLALSVVALAHLPFAAHVDLPAVDDTLLGGTAATQGAYVLKKIGSPVGH